MPVRPLTPDEAADLVIIVRHPQFDCMFAPSEGNKTWIFDFLVNGYTNRIERSTLRAAIRAAMRWIEKWEGR